MSAIKDVAYDIAEDIEAGVLTFAQIAEKYSVSVTFVTMVFESMMEDRDD